MRNGNSDKQKDLNLAREHAPQEDAARGRRGAGGAPGAEPEHPLWVPYTPPPPQGGREQIAVAAQRHGFTAAVLVVLAGVLGALLWLAPELGDAGGEAAARGAPPLAIPPPAEANPYTGTATLSVTSRPSGATVLLGGDTLGVTPLTDHTVPAGVHLVTVAEAQGGVVDSVLILRSDQPNGLRVTLGEGPREAPAQARTPATAAQETTPARPPEPTEAQQEAAAAEARRQARARSYARAMHEGNERFIEEDYVEARRAYEAALALRPDDERAASRLQRTDSLLARRAEAQAQYQYYRARGDVLFEQDRFQDAIAAYRQALDLRPGDIYAQGRLSRSQAEARAALEEAAQAAQAAPPAQAEQRTPFVAPELPANEAAPARLNLNTATAAQLERLPRIGPTLSQRIVEDRATYGRFRSTQDLMRVSGIGPKTLEAIEDLIFAGEE